MSLHFYCFCRFSKKWVESHEEACRALGMQLVLQEYGIMKVQDLENGGRVDTMKERVEQMKMVSQPGN